MRSSRNRVGGTALIAAAIVALMALCACGGESDPPKVRGAVTYHSGVAYCSKGYVSVRIYEKGTGHIGEATASLSGTYRNGQVRLQDLTVDTKNLGDWVIAAVISVEYSFPGFGLVNALPPIDKTSPDSPHTVRSLGGGAGVRLCAHQQPPALTTPSPTFSGASGS
jgi:hypothetical protein